MKVSSIGMVLGWLSVLGGGGFLAQQILEAKGLSAESTRLERIAAARGVAQDGPWAPVPAGGPVPGARPADRDLDQELDPAERIELMQLRSQVTDLRSRKRALAPVLSEVVALQARLAAVSNYAVGRLPAGYLRRGDARNAGRATPEAAMETFLWAVEQRDAGQLLASIPSGDRPLMERQLEHLGTEPFFKQLPLPGYRILLRESRGTNRVELTLESVPGMPWRCLLLLEGDDWRVRM